MRILNALITIYNKSSIEASAIIENNKIITYAVFQLEECPTTKKPHLQMYIELAKQQSLRQIKKIFNDNTIHIDSRKGTQKQAIAYCSKEDTRIEEPVFLGVPKTQGKRTDLDSIKEAVKNGEKLIDIIDNIESINFQKIRVAQILKTIYSQQRTEKPTVIWIYGKTGTGKTRWVYENHNDIYTKPNNKWWDGYEQQETILIDDYRKDFCKFHELLTLTDRYPTKREIKGGTIEINSKYIIFTAPHSPRQMWDGRTDEALNQLIRRIDKVYKFQHKDNNIRYNITECQDQENTSESECSSDEE